MKERKKIHGFQNLFQIKMGKVWRLLSTPWKQLPFLETWWHDGAEMLFFNKNMGAEAWQEEIYCLKSQKCNKIVRKNGNRTFCHIWKIHCALPWRHTISTVYHHAVWLVFPHHRLENQSELELLGRWMVFNIVESLQKPLWGCIW